MARRAHLFSIVFALMVSCSCSESSGGTMTPSPGSPTVSSLALTGGRSLTGAGQTVQLTATANFSDGTSQNVTALVTWQSSNTSIATISSGGLVTALAAGTVTVTATYQGTSATVSIPITLATSTANIMTASIDGAAFSSIIVTVLKTSNSGVPSGQLLGLTGTSGFLVPYQILTIAVPAAVGTYDLGPLKIPNGSLHLQASVTTSNIWDTLQSGASGTVTVTSLTSTTASGTFSMSLRASSPTGASGTKQVTNGVFNVRF